MESDVVYNGEYFYVRKKDISGKKTPVYEIYDRNSVCIAVIKWYGAWRKFCLFTEGTGVVWDNKCLIEVVQLLDKYNIEWKYKSKGDEEVKDYNLKWYVLLHDFNNDRIVKYNILENNKDLIDEIVKSVKNKKITNYNDLKEMVTRKLKSIYWSRTEYEILVSGLFSKNEPEKIDVWYQLELNLDNLIEYLISKLNLNIK